MKTKFAVAANLFYVRYTKLILDNVDDPGLIEAINADGIDEEYMFFDNNELYETLNAAGSKTRDWLILKAISTAAP